MQSNSDISRLRVLVGYLGEHHQANWWSSSFLGRSSEAFLTPIFGNAVANARVVGVTEATRRVHDDAIGVGRTFHLFRLPETLEQELHRTLSTSKDMAIPESVDAAIEEMRALSSRDDEPKPGPIHVGPLHMLADAQWIPVVASHYRGAFVSGFQSFPYFTG
jgi:hypothetical protein